MQDISKLNQVWNDFIVGKTFKKGEIRHNILESWTRCNKYQIDPYLKNNTKYSMYSVRERLKSKEQLVNISIEIIKEIYSFLEDPAFIVALTDEDGCILYSTGKESLINANNNTEMFDFAPGSCWSEEEAGTNAIGTSLYLKVPVQVYSQEHYCIGAKPWNGAAAPIIFNQKVLGSLCVSETFEEHQLDKCKIGMAVAIASTIESRLKFKIASEYQNQLMETISDGIIILSAGGKFTCINRMASKILGLKPHEIIGKKIDTVFEDDRSSTNVIKLVNEAIFENHEIIDQETTMNTKTNIIRAILSLNKVRNNDSNIVYYILLINEIKRARKLVQQMVGAKATFTFDNIVGKNVKFVNTIKVATAMANTDSVALLLGESGTGKDVFAQAIHNASHRSSGPFVAINCAAIPKELIGSELFGYTEGAFTGAKKGGSPGKFELADGGTILLDEIGEMPLDMQSVLLRVLEEKSVVRLGGRQVIPLDVRIIAATNRDLFQAVKENKFREDLFYRIYVLVAEMIPLRERKDDISMLTEFFVRKIGERLGKKMSYIEPAVFEILENHSWPGNIRELENCIERAINMNRGTVLMKSSFQLGNASINSSVTPKKIERQNIPLVQMEKHVIIEALIKNNLNITKAAKMLGISRSTLYRKIKRYDLDSDIVNNIVLLPSTRQG